VAEIQAMRVNHMMPHERAPWHPMRVYTPKVSVIILHVYVNLKSIAGWGGYIWEDAFG
jgi:hypothetical protein